MQETGHRAREPVRVDMEIVRLALKIQKIKAKAWAEGFKAAEDNDCCGCNLSRDDDGNEVVNPYK